VSRSATSVVSDTGLATPASSTATVRRVLGDPPSAIASPGLRTCRSMHLSAVGLSVLAFPNRTSAVSASARRVGGSASHHALSLHALSRGARHELPRREAPSQRSPYKVPRREQHCRPVARAAGASRPGAQRPAPRNQRLVTSEPHPAVSTTAPLVHS